MWLVSYDATKEPLRPLYTQFALDDDARIKAAIVLALSRWRRSLCRRQHADRRAADGPRVRGDAANEQYVRFGTAAQERRRPAHDARRLASRAVAPFAEPINRRSFRCRSAERNPERTILVEIDSAAD